MTHTCMYLLSSWKDEPLLHHYHLSTRDRERSCLFCLYMYVCTLLNACKLVLSWQLVVCTFAFGNCDICTVGYV